MMKFILAFWKWSVQSQKALHWLFGPAFWLVFCWCSMSYSKYCSIFSARHLVIVKKREPRIHSLHSHSKDWILASLPNFLKPVSAIELRDPSFIKLINFIDTCFKEDHPNKNEQKWKMLCWIVSYQGPLAILDQIISQQFVLKSLLFCLMGSRMGTHHQKELSTLKPRLAQPQY